MKINEIIVEETLRTSSGYKKHIKNIENELGDGLTGVRRLPRLFPIIWSDYSSGKISPPEALHLIEALKAIYEDLLYDDDVWNELSRHDPSGKIAKQIFTDIIQQEKYMEDYINTIKQKHGLKEDITDFKAANGQLSAMGSKRPKTKKDAARNKVEQLFKEDKK